MRGDLFHALHLLYVEGAAALAVAAMQAVAGVEVEAGVVFLGQLVAGAGEIVELVDQADVEAGRAGHAVVAVDAAALRAHRRELADGGVIAHLRRGVQKGEDLFQIVQTAHAGQHGDNARAVERVLQALIRGERLPEGRKGGIEQLAPGEGLHRRNAHAVALAIAVERGALFHRADAVFALLVIVGGVDAEHEQVDLPAGEQAAGDGRIVRGKADVAHLALGLEVAQVIQQAAAHDRLGVFRLVHAVEEAKVRVFETEGLRLPREGAADGVQIARPCVGGAIVEGAEVHLQQRVAPAAFEGGGHRLDGGALGGGEV